MRGRTGWYLTGFAWAAIAACGGLSHERDSQVGNSAAGAGANGVSGAGGKAGGNGLGNAGTGSVHSASAGAAGSSSPSLPPQSTRIPEKHRALATSCDHQRPPGNAGLYGEAIACPQDGGTCPVPDGCDTCRSACLDYGDGGGPRCVSSYGECLRDADCTAQDNGRCSNNRGNFFCTYDTCYSDATCTGGGPCACEGESGSPGNTCLPGNCRTDADCGGSNGFCSPTFGGCGDYGGVIAYYCHTAADTCVDDADCTSSPQGAGYCMYIPDVGHWTCGYGQCAG